MRFIKDGPDIPNRLVQAHEDGEVIFFCGAGISYPAGLPGFKGLTNGIFESLGENPNSAEKKAIDEGRFDQALDLLERRIKKRSVVREKIKEILTPKDLGDSASTATHLALLTLAKNKDQTIRLITTNFDRIFIRLDPSLHHYVAPLLPVPKKSRWNGLVYLHGLLPENNNAAALNSLVVSSGDFGLAYLAERWASRFITELFRNYVVCFIGYSIDDPVMRYMLDALSADRLLGEMSEEVYAFGSFAESAGDSAQAEQDWCSKGVVPILYPETHSHQLLHETLLQWSELYRDGITGRRALIVREASGAPSQISSDGQVERVLWALMEPSGQTARVFADLDPVPLVQWLNLFEEPRFTEKDLHKLGITPSSSSHTPTRFSLLDHPAPLSSGALMSLVNMGESHYTLSQLDEVMWHIGRWIVRHLDKPEVLMWAIRHGCSLHPSFKELIVRKLNDELSSLPRPVTTIWRMICAGLGTNSRHRSSMHLYRWADELKRSGWNFLLKRELLRLLRPLICFSEPFRWRQRGQGEEGNHEAIPEEMRIRDLVNWEITLNVGEHPWEKLKEIKTHPDWTKAAIECLPYFTSSLQESMDMMAELEGASDKSDFSYINRPSITDHEQNNDFHEWTCLIELCRDAWLCAAAETPSLAKAELERWQFIKFPIFRRLEFFAASESSLIHPSEGLALLLQDNGWWLWSSETQRESFRLLLSLGPKLDDSQLDTLCNTILAGPPRIMFRDDLQEMRWEELAGRAIWLRLKILGTTDVSLSNAAKKQLQTLSNKYPRWTLQSGERDHFPTWMESGEGELIGEHITLPREIDKLINALAIRPTDNIGYKDDWREICKADANQAINALKNLAARTNWNIGVWRDALQVLAESDNRILALTEIGPQLLNAPNQTIRELRHTYAWWLKILVKDLSPLLQNIWFQLIDRVFENADKDVNSLEGDPVGRAINNPVGHATEAILSWWYQTDPMVGSELHEPVKARLTMLTNPAIKGFVHGRTIMAAHLTSLYSADPAWTAQHLLPYFDWGTNPTEAQAVWEGYLWTPRISAELLDAFKAPFLKTACKYNSLGKHDKQYASLLVVAALELRDQLTIGELRDTFNALPKEGLAEAAKMLARSLGSAENRRPDYWTHRVKPLIESAWPKSHDKRTGNESAAFMELCVYAGPLFLQAFNLLKPMIIQTKHFYLPVKALAESELATQYPSEALSLLNAIVDESEQWPLEELSTCLEQIMSVKPEVGSEASFRRLREYYNRYSRG
ncbi:MAG: SIR2 family protein [Nitrospira sp.]